MSLAELLNKENEVLKREKEHKLRVAFQHVSESHMIKIDKEDEDSFIFEIFEPKRDCFNLVEIAKKQCVAVHENNKGVFSVFVVV